MQQQKTEIATTLDSYGFRAPHSDQNISCTKGVRNEKKMFEKHQKSERTTKAPHTGTQKWDPQK